MFLVDTEASDLRSLKNGIDAVPASHQFSKEFATAMWFLVFNSKLARNTAKVILGISEENEFTDLDRTVTEETARGIIAQVIAKLTV